MSFAFEIVHHGLLTIIDIGVFIVVMFYTRIVQRNDKTQHRSTHTFSSISNHTHVTRSTLLSFVK
jgi:hypothetical protein